MMAVTRQLLALGLGAALLTGCGARTGLWEEAASEGDADLGPAPDVFGNFPCFYNPVRAPEPIRQGAGHSLEPRMAWGEERLGLSYVVANEPSDLARGAPTFCTTDRDEHFACASETVLGTEALLRIPLTWDGDGWGLCWSEADPLGMLPTFRRLSPEGDLQDDARVISSISGSCLDLVWAGDHHAVGLLEWDLGTEWLRVRRLDGQGEILRPAVSHHVAGPLVFGSLATAEGMEVLSYTSPGLLTVWRLDEDVPAFERTLSEDLLAVRVALKPPLAGVLWLVQSGPRRRLLFALLDVERGLMAEAAEITSSEGSLSPTIIAVNEGFIIAWSEWTAERDRVAAVAVRFDEWEANFWSELVFHEGPHQPLFELTRDPALAYSGRDAFIAFSMVDQETGRLQVHVQELDCHR